MESVAALADEYPTRAQRRAALVSAVAAVNRDRYFRNDDASGQSEYMCDFMCPAENPVSWRNRPATYTCIESCSLVFGGEPSDYSCSTVETFVNNQAYYQVYGEAEAVIDVEDADLDCDTYTSHGCKTAYVGDHLWLEERNYCWSNSGAGGLSEDTAATKQVHHMARTVHQHRLRRPR